MSLSVEAIICLACGAGLLILELLMPGFGLPGISGIALILGGVWMVAAKAGTAMATLALLLTLVALVLVACLVLRSLTKGKLRNSRFFLHTEEDFKPAEEESSLAGMQGTALTALRPSGKAEVGGKRLDVVTDGEFIEAGESIRIESAQGRRIVVTRCTAETEEIK